MVVFFIRMAQGPALQDAPHQGGDTLGFRLSPCSLPSPTTGQAVTSSCGLSCGSTAAHGVVYREGQAPCLQIKIRLSNVCWQHIDTHTNRHALKPLTHAQAQISGVSPLRMYT